MFPNQTEGGRKNWEIVAGNVFMK